MSRPVLADLDEVARVELIDHRSDAPNLGRVFVAWDVQIDLSFQDKGRTLKVFVVDQK